MRRPLQVAFALVGWYLIIPPTTQQNTADLHAPLSEWVSSGSFDTSGACEDVLRIIKKKRVRTAKADAVSGRQDRGGEGPSLADWMAGRRETDDLKPIDTSHRKDDGESPGR